MDDPAQAAAYAAADFSEPHQAFVEYFRERFPDFVSGRVLDLGCGNADVTVRFARAFPSVSIVGVDASRPMLDLGMRAVSVAGLGTRISFWKCHLPDAALTDRPFDAVICNSLLHHLAAPSTLWQTVAMTAKHGAPVLVMDLMRPATRDAAEDLVSLHAADAPAILRRDFFNSLLAAYTSGEVAAQLAQAGLPFRVETVSDRHMLVWGHVR